MAHIFVACPKCGAGYKIAKEHLSTAAVCRSCGHRWVPAEARGEAGSAEEGPAPGEDGAEAGASAPAKAEAPKAGDSPADALAALADAARQHAGGKASAPAKPASAEAGAPRPPAAKAAEEKSPPPKSPPEEKPAGQPAAPKPTPEEKRAKPTSPSGKKGGGAGGDARLDALEAMARAAKGKPSPKAKAPKDRGGHARHREQTDETDPLVGTQVNGFKIQTRIGTGGFGVVYRAFDTNLERSVAIKMLPADIADAGQGVIERFLREARSAAKLAHPNIVTIHQICPYQNTYYIVMELVDGGALHEYLANRKRLPPEEATRIVRAAAEGLGHAHKRGIIHRDIKPGNIMLTNDGQVKVSDFGLARDVLQGHDIVGAGHSLGTPRYMAPEQALGEEPSASSDLYSLAATYYALVTGRAAFDGTNDRDIMKKQVQAPVPDPRQFVPGLPVAVYRFFEKAMAKQPEDRYLTAEEFIAALDRLDFSKTEGAVSESQDLIDQLGAVSAEDRTSHLSQTLGRAVRRAQRQRTPMPESAVDDIIGAGTAVGRKAGWKLWVVIGVLVLAVIGGAVAAAILLAPEQPGTGEPEAGGAAATAGTGETAPEEPPETKPPTGETGTGETGGEEPTPPKPSKSPLEDVAQEVLAEVRAYEADPDTPVYELVRMYRENVIQVYPGTNAAKEAQEAIKRLESGERLEGVAPPKEESPPPAEPSAEPPAEGGTDGPAEAKPAQEGTADTPPAGEEPGDGTPPA